MTIKESQELIEVWSEKNAIRHNELTNMALLTEEIGKLAMIMARRYGDHVSDSGFRSDASGQIGDVLWALIGVANQTEVDMTAALADALQRKSLKGKKK